MKQFSQLFATFNINGIDVRVEFNFDTITVPTDWRCNFNLKLNAPEPFLFKAKTQTADFKEYVQVVPK